MSNVMSAVRFETDLDYPEEIRARADRVRWVIVPARRYLSIEGRDRPGSDGFRDAIGTLYPVAYTLHFDLKKRGVTAPVGALEGLYWTEPGEPLEASRFSADPSGSAPWEWRLQLPVPAAAGGAEIDAAIEDVRRTKPAPLMDRLRADVLEEGAVGQILHIGPYDTEAGTIARLHGAIVEAGLALRGVHHEIYIGDPNRSRPERLRTLLRQPVQT